MSEYNLLSRLKPDFWGHDYWYTAKSLGERTLGGGNQLLEKY